MTDRTEKTPAKGVRIMDELTRLLAAVKASGAGASHLLGVMNVLIGRRITRHSDGALVSRGISWRDLAALLKKVRWDPEAAREIGLDPDQLPPRDRQRFWYVAITQANVSSETAVQAGDKFAVVAAKVGYDVG